MAADTYSYDVFGAATHVGSSANYWQFTGEQHDGSEVEGLHALVPLSPVERPQKLSNFIILEAGERDVLRFRVEVLQEAGEQSFVPVALDPVQAQIEKARLIRRQFS